MTELAGHVDYSKYALALQWAAATLMPKYITPPELLTCMHLR